MRLMQIGLVSLLFIGCDASSLSDATRQVCLKEMANNIENARVNDTLDLNLDCIAFDKVIIMSHEVNSQFLLKEIKLSKDAKEKIKAKTEDYNNANWAIAWVKDSTLVDKIEFSPTSLMLDNLVDGKGYAEIDRAGLSPLLVIATDQVFVGTQDTVLDVKMIF